MGAETLVTWSVGVDGPLAEVRADKGLALWYKSGAGWAASAVRPAGDGVSLSSPAAADRLPYGVLYRPEYGRGYTQVADVATPGAANDLMDALFAGSESGVVLADNYLQLVAGLDHGGTLGEYVIYANWGHKDVTRRSR